MYRLTNSLLRSFAHSSSQKLHSSTQHVIAGRLEPLQYYSTLEGHGYSRNKKRPTWSFEQLEIVEALQSGERSKASSLLSKMGRQKRSLSSRDFAHILHKCAETPDPVFVKETQRVMREVGVVLDQECYLYIIRALCKGGLVDEAFNEIYNLQDNHKLDPNLKILNVLLGGCANSQRDRASECLDLMEKLLLGKDEVTYLQLLKLAVSVENLSLVHKMWKECTKYYSPNIILLQKFVWSFSRLGDVESAYDILLKMVSLALRGDFVIKKSTVGKFSILRLDVPMPCFQDTDKASEISTFKYDFEGAKLRTSKRFHDQAVASILQSAYDCLIYAFGRISNFTLVEQLFIQMQDLGIEPSATSYDGFIKAAVSERGYHVGLELLETMRQKNLKPKDSTLVSVIVGCCKDYELDLAESLLDQYSIKDDVLPYNYFLSACDKLDKPERAVRVLAKMKEMKVMPDITTYESLFSLFVSCNAPYEEGNMLLHVDVNKRIKAIEDAMAENNFQHSAKSLGNLLKSLGAEGMISKLIQYLSMAENQLSRGFTCLDTSTYNVVLHSLVCTDEVHTAIKIFKSMKPNGFLPDAATYDIMISCCRINFYVMSAWALLALMIRDGFNPRLVTYTNLIKIFSKNGDIDEALNLLDQGLVEGIEPDVTLYNDILYMARAKERIDVIELLVDQMHKYNVQPDPKTCSNVFAAYVNQNYMNTAVEALQVLSIRMISLNDSFLEKNKTEIEENYIYAEDSEADSRILDLFADYKEYIAVALFNLRWCATLGFPISWSPNQSLWSKRLSSNYDTCRKRSRDSFSWLHR